MIEPTQETIESMQTAERCQLELCIGDVALAMNNQISMQDVMDRFLDRHIDLSY